MSQGFLFLITRETHTPTLFLVFLCFYHVFSVSSWFFPSSIPPFYSLFRFVSKSISSPSLVLPSILDELHIPCVPPHPDNLFSYFLSPLVFHPSCREKEKEGEEGRKEKEEEGEWEEEGRCNWQTHRNPRDREWMLRWNEYSFISLLLLSQHIFLLSFFVLLSVFLGFSCCHRDAISSPSIQTRIEEEARDMLLSSLVQKKEILLLSFSLLLLFFFSSLPNRIWRPLIARDIVDIFLVFFLNFLSFPPVICQSLHLQYKPERDESDRKTTTIPLVVKMTFLFPSNSSFSERSQSLWLLSNSLVHFPGLHVQGFRDGKAFSGFVPFLLSHLICFYPLVSCVVRKYSSALLSLIECSSAFGAFCSLILQSYSPDLFSSLIECCWVSPAGRGRQTVRRHYSTLKQWTGSERKRRQKGYKRKSVIKTTKKGNCMNNINSVWLTLLLSLSLSKRKRKERKEDANSLKKTRQEQGKEEETFWEVKEEKRQEESEDHRKMNMNNDDEDEEEEKSSWKKVSLSWRSTKRCISMNISIRSSSVVNFDYRHLSVLKKKNTSKKYLWSIEKRKRKRWREEDSLFFFVIEDEWLWRGIKEWIFEMQMEWNLFFSSFFLLKSDTHCIWWEKSGDEK